MERKIVPEGYTPLLSIYETQKAIGLLKRLFEDELSGALRLHRVSAPLFVSAGSGLNDIAHVNFFNHIRCDAGTGNRFLDYNFRLSSDYDSPKISRSNSASQASAIS